jgi:hypothetical protein
VLKRTAAITKIPSLRYEIAAREPFTPDFGLATGPYQVQVSKIKLDLGLLHENDLSAVLAALDGSRTTRRGPFCAVGSSRNTTR